MIEDWIYEKLKEDIGRKRYEHSLRVMDTSVELAKIYKCSEEKAAIAGLLHDCGKFEDRKIILKKARSFDIILDDVTKNNIGLIHSPLGAVLAKKVYKIEDEDVLSAIRFHTTGRENMSLLEKIIYIADLIEPNRTYSGVEKIRAMAYKDIDKSLIYSLDRTIKLIINRKQLIHLNTVEARNYLIMS